MEAIAKCLIYLAYDLFQQPDSPAFKKVLKIYKHRPLVIPGIVPGYIRGSYAAGEVDDLRFSSPL
jgi:hypothetical protein